MIMRDDEVKARNQLRAARKEHAMLLRCEGLSFGQVAKRLGVSRARAAVMSENAAQKLNWAMRRTKLRVVEDEALK